MKNGEGRDETLVAEVGVEGRQLIGGAHRLVGQCAKRHRRHVRAQSRGPNGALDAFARPKTSGLRLGIRHRTVRGDDGLLDHGRRGAGQVAQRIGLDWDRAPVDQVEMLRPAGLLEEPAGSPPLLIPIRRRRIGQEHDRDSELEGRVDVDG